MRLFLSLQVCMIWKGPEKLQHPYPMISSLQPKTWFHIKWKSFLLEKMFWVIIICKWMLMRTHICIAFPQYLLQLIPTETKNAMTIFILQSRRSEKLQFSRVTNWPLTGRGRTRIDLPSNPAPSPWCFQNRMCCPHGSEKGLRKVLARRRNMRGVEEKSKETVEII